MVALFNREDGKSLRSLRQGARNTAQLATRHHGQTIRGRLIQIPIDQRTGGALKSRGHAARGGKQFGVVHDVSPRYWALFARVPFAQDARNPCAGGLFLAGTTHYPPS